jgi:cytochrome c
VDGTDGTGPHLNGVVGRAIASVGGFGYSDGLKALAAKSWTPEELDHWLENPKGYAPGNKMSFAGLPKVEDRANLVAYLASLQ